MSAIVSCIGRPAGIRFRTCHITGLGTCVAIRSWLDPSGLSLPRGNLMERRLRLPRSAGAVRCRAPGWRWAPAWGGVGEAVATGWARFKFPYSCSCC